MLLTEYNEQKFLEQEREVWKEEGRSEGISLGITQGITQGEERMNQLIQCLIRDNRSNEIERAVTDTGFQRQLLETYGLLG